MKTTNSFMNYQVIRMLTILAILIAAGLPGYSLVIIPNNANVAGIWTAANSPYVLQGKAFIQPGQALWIQPGVTVKFQTGNNNNYADPAFNMGMLIVYGKLTAAGQANNFIRFTRNGNAGNWGMVYFRNNLPQSGIQYCKFDFGREVRNLPNNAGGNSIFRGVVSFAGLSGCPVSHCIFAENTYGIHCFNTSRDLSDNSFIHNVKGGILCSNSSAPLIKNSTFIQSKEGITCESGCSPEIFNNVIRDNTIAISGNFMCNPFIHNNLLSAVNFGIFMFDNCIPRISNCIITDALQGVCAEHLSTIKVRNTVIYGTNAAVTAWGDATVTVANCILRGNQADFGFQGLNNHVTLSYSSIQGLNLPAQVLSLGGNLFGQNPWFRDPLNGDFRLMCSQCFYPHNSPCINAGNPAPADNDTCLGCESGLQGSRNDMGAYGGPLNCWGILPVASLAPLHHFEQANPAMKEGEALLPENLEFLVYPNPASDRAEFSFSPTEDGNCDLSVYDISGNKVRTVFNGFLAAGMPRVFTWFGDQQSGERACPGMYFYVLQLEKHRYSGKILLK